MGEKRSNGSKFKLVAQWHRSSQQAVGQRQEYTSTETHTLSPTCNSFSQGNINKGQSWTLSQTLTCVKVVGSSAHNPEGNDPPVQRVQFLVGLLTIISCRCCRVHRLNLRKEKGTLSKNFPAIIVGYKNKKGRFFFFVTSADQAKCCKP